MSRFFMLRDGVRVGPMGPSELLENGLSRGTLVWAEGMEEWIPASEVPELRDIEGGLPPDPPGGLPIRPRPENGNLATVDTSELPYSPEQFDQRFAGPTLLAIACLLVGAVLAASRKTALLSVPLALIAVIAGLVVVIRMCRLIFRVLTLLRGRGGRLPVTPTVAIVLLFVPVVNFFWRLYALPVIALDLNRLRVRRGLRPSGLLVALAITAAVVGAASSCLGFNLGMALLMKTPGHAMRGLPVATNIVGALSLICHVALLTRLRAVAIEVVTPRPE